ncbi:MAG: hypothetical protein M0042_14870 [Nitrospiraceae bacterium]|nr:hypothetical protein [Nitrospiraceae bacterium]
MLHKTRVIGRIFFLFYALYALTPVSMYAVGAGQCFGTKSGKAVKHSPSDIVWENIIFACLSDDDDAYEPPSGDTQAIGTQQDGDIVLVRKKRTIVRQRLDLRPTIRILILPQSSFETETASVIFRETPAPLLRETDGYLVLNTGLSPPALLS